jgi:hypothetical protein
MQHGRRGHDGRLQHLLELRRLEVWVTQFTRVRAREGAPLVPCNEAVTV